MSSARRRGFSLALPREAETIGMRHPSAEIAAHTFPTWGDPVVMLMPDQTSFSCWVEAINGGRHWVFFSTSGFTYIGPRYGNEDSLKEIRDVLSHWRTSGVDAVNEAQ